MKIFKQWFCEKHKFKHHFNIYGDGILHSGGKRSVWKCELCGKHVDSYKLKKQYHNDKIKRSDLSFKRNIFIALVDNLKFSYFR